MKGFYKEIYSKENIKIWLDYFDWLFDEHKFDIWDSNDFGMLTRKIKLRFPNNSFYEGSIKNIKRFFPQSNKRNIYVVMQKNRSVSESFVKHIRNGFAHGNVVFKKNRKFIEIKDYFTKDSRYAKKGDLSAYMLLPEDFLFDLMKNYNNINMHK